METMYIQQQSLYYNIQYFVIVHAKIASNTNMIVSNLCLS